MKKPTYITRIFKRHIFLMINIFAFTSFFGYLFYLEMVTTVPDFKTMKKIPILETSIIYDKNNNELYRIYEENRTYVKIDDISKNMINAIVAGEDKNFWNNPGFDIKGIARSIRDGLGNDFRFVGTSGITQQLSKIIFLSGERTLDRKVKELYLSIKLTNNYEKEYILETYLNKVFFGGNSYGIEESSKTFFNKKAKDLNILESSILASLPKSPTELSPYNKKGNLLGYPSLTEKYIEVNEKKDEKMKKVKK
ncbi:MAG: biosynthetic peptidoglycan transglycosylase [Candidatus Gracilibacteria bacterium]|nr:biosynthetic peptidoglycan transglycosylase [Candidatus Gracilibacteria bacterium]